MICLKIGRIFVGVEGHLHRAGDRHLRRVAVDDRGADLDTARVDVIAEARALASTPGRESPSWPDRSNWLLIASAWPAQASAATPLMSCAATFVEGVADEAAGSPPPAPSGLPALQAAARIGRTKMVARSRAAIRGAGEAGRSWPEAYPMVGQF